MITILDKQYHGFEDAVDIDRDVSEMFDSWVNPNAAKIPGEFQGTIRVLITYEPSPEDEEP